MRTRRGLLLAVAVAAIAASAGLGVADTAAGEATVSAPGCTPSGPVLLSQGAAPRRQLRLDLARLSGVTKGATSIERVDSRTTLADGSVQPASSTRQVTEVFKTGKLASGRVPYIARLGVSFPGSAGGGTPKKITLSGYFDARNGGAVGAQGTPSQVIPGELPAEAVGSGATWRVVNCNQIDSLYAQETRTYTLRSISKGVVVASYSDVVTLDPAHVGLGTQQVNGSAVAYRLLALNGTATGSLRLPLANPLAQSSKTVTRLRFSFRASMKTAKSDAIRTSLMDTVTDTPTS